MKERRKSVGKRPSNVHKVRFVVGSALIGSVVAGALLGWMDTSFDFRAVGAGVGVLAGLASMFHVA